MNAGSMGRDLGPACRPSPPLWLTSRWPPTCSPWPRTVYRWPPAANPVLISVGILLVIVLLQVTDTPYQRYFDGAQFVHFLLGPATVALAIPLHGQLKRLVAMAAAARRAGRQVAGGRAVGLLHQCPGASAPTLASLAPRSVTAHRNGDCRTPGRAGPSPRCS